ncbi:hypothetical protein Ais01nite_74890 [Asanoa ishikariensis]|nr:hypothetical protein Ais01nite_74890 [Asanoa ishikariensis]
MDELAESGVVALAGEYHSVVARAVAARADGLGVPFARQRFSTRSAINRPHVGREADAGVERGRPRGPPGSIHAAPAARQERFGRSSGHRMERSGSTFASSKVEAGVQLTQFELGRRLYGYTDAPCGFP